MHEGEEGHAWPGWTTSNMTGPPVEESIRMTEDRDKWRKYVHGVANPRIEDGQRTEQSRPAVVQSLRTPSPFARNPGDATGSDGRADLSDNRAVSGLFAASAASIRGQQTDFLRCRSSCCCCYSRAGDRANEMKINPSLDRILWISDYGGVAGGEGECDDDVARLAVRERRSLATANEVEMNSRTGSCGFRGFRSKSENREIRRESGRRRG